LLYTFRAAGALKGWCAVRTLQEMVGSALPTNVQSRAKGRLGKCRLSGKEAEI
jgi:hypothetical protein